MRCCCSADPRFISRVDAATGIINRLVNRSTTVGVDAGVLALADGSKVYWTAGYTSPGYAYSTGKLYEYDTATKTITEFPVLDPLIEMDNRSLCGLALHPVTGRMYVLADRPPFVGMYSVDLANPASWATKILNVSVADSVYGSLQYLAFNNSSPDSYYTAYSNRTIYKWVEGQQPIPLTAPTGTGMSDGTLLNNTRFGVFGIAFNSAGDMLVSEAAAGKVFLVQAGTGKIKRVSGSTFGNILNPGNALNSSFSFTRGVDFGPGDESIFMADQNNHRIVRVLLNCTMV
jgi:hypothetical protein